MSLESIQNRIESIKNNLDELSIINEVYEAEQKLKEIEEKIQKTKDEIDEINSDESLFRPLLNSLKSEEKDLQIYENKYQNLVKYWEKKRREEELVKGNLTGTDALKAQREMGLDNLREVDNQGLIIESIGNNIKDANSNLVNINNELANQGEQMNRIQEKTHQVESSVKQTGKIMNKMEVRVKCIQILAFIAVIVVGLLDISLITAVIVKFIKSRELEGIRNDILENHNYHRKRHQVNGLKREKEIEKLAQGFSEDFLLKGKFDESKNIYKHEKLGVNIYKITIKNEEKTKIGKIVSNIWYEENKLYEFDNEKRKSDEGKFLEFTQMVWKASKLLGCGRSCKNNECIVLCNYYPIGNVPNKFDLNVFPLKEEENDGGIIGKIFLLYLVLFLLF